MMRGERKLLNEPARTFEEIAAELRIPLSTVHWLYRQAMRKLRAAMECFDDAT